MKKILILLTAAFPWTLRAHDHIEIALSGNQTQLIRFAGQQAQLMTYFPAGEKPSFDTYAFPGGAFATVLTFSAFDNTPPPPNGALVRIDVLSVSGPDGGSFSFWEVGASAPTWSRPSGWASSISDTPALFASEDETGYGHIHGRAFSADKPGTYDVTFRAVDTTAAYASSTPFTVRFTALTPPQLAISLVNGTLKVSFLSRSNLAYDLQSSTSLQPDSWTTLDTLDGTGGMVEILDPLANRPRVFYRLVEYR